MVEYKSNKRINQTHSEAIPQYDCFNVKTILQHHFKQDSAAVTGIIAFFLTFFANAIIKNGNFFHKELVTHY